MMPWSSSGYYSDSNSEDDIKEIDVVVHKSPDNDIIEQVQEVPAVDLTSYSGEGDGVNDDPSGPSQRERVETFYREVFPRVADGAKENVGRAMERVLALTREYRAKYRAALKTYVSMRSMERDAKQEYSKRSGDTSTVSLLHVRRDLTKQAFEEKEKIGRKLTAAKMLMNSICSGQADTLRAVQLPTSVELVDRIVQGTTQRITPQSLTSPRQRQILPHELPMGVSRGSGSSGTGYGSSGSDRGSSNVPSLFDRRVRSSQTHLTPKREGSSRDLKRELYGAGEAESSSMAYSATDPSSIADLIKNISFDIDIKPEDREGTPKEMEVTLLEHQKLGLTWLQQMEKRTSSKGGILADDMGLGKTIQMLALMVTRPRPNNRRDVNKTTLIVAPVALLRQWALEIRTRLKVDLKVLICHSSNGVKAPQTSFKYVSEHDVVITSYQTLASEYKSYFHFEDNRIVSHENRSSPFYSGTFWRVILDEAQFIKNKDTRAAQACSGVNSEYRWCLSGTPMQNRVEEMYSLIKFLRIRPYCDEKRFMVEIARGLGIDEEDSPRREEAMRKFRALLKGVLLRRSKSSFIDGRPILDLPPKKVILVSHDFFDPAEREYYVSLEAGAQKQVSKYMNSGVKGIRAYSGILSLLLRLRQACCHPHLIFKSQLLKKLNASKAMTSLEALKLARRFDNETTRKVLAQDMDNALCPQCNDTFDESNCTIFSPCGHSMCSDCSVEYLANLKVDIEGNVIVCPTCDRQIHETGIAYSVFAQVHRDGMTNTEILAGHKSSSSVIPLKERLKRQSNLIRDLHPTKRLAYVHGKGNNARVPKITAKDEEELLSPDSFNFSDSFSDSDLDMTEFDVAKREDVEDNVYGTRLVKEDPSASGSQLRVKGDPVGSDNECNGSGNGSGNRSGNGFGNGFGNGSGNGSITQRVKEDPVLDLANYTSESQLVTGNSLVNGTVVAFPKNDISTSGVSDEDKRRVITQLGLGLIFPEGWISSTKVEKCVQLVQEIHKKQPDEKIIIFSQFTSLLDFIEVALVLVGETFLRYDGSMTSVERNDAVCEFYLPHGPKVMLISLKAGNVGLTLTCANHVIIVDPFWNPFVEEQAMDRAHRIGQHRPVFVHRLFLTNTVEDRIMQLQEKKRDLVTSALDEKALRNVGKLSDHELMFLFGLRSSNESG